MMNARTLLDRVEQYATSFKTDQSFKSPVFILSPPRSGSTLLFETMFRFDELLHFNHESDFIWWQHFPYDKMACPSDYIGEEYICPENIDLIRKYTYTSVIGKTIGEASHMDSNTFQYGRNKIRYLDKTIANCFHLPFLKKAFPTAQFIFLVRDPRDNISSMLEGWPYIERFGKPQLTPLIQSIPNATITHWTYPAPPGWRTMVTRPLPEICAWSWQKHVEHVLEFFRGKRRKGHILIRYEDLLESPVGIYTDLSKKLNLRLTEKILDYAKKPALSYTAVSRPERDKWRKKHYQEIMSVLPLIEGTALEIGYKVNL